MHHIFSILCPAIIVFTSSNIASADSYKETPSFLEMEVQLAQNWSATEVQYNLKTQGYQILSVTKTFLGRIKIKAQNDDHNRILVMAPYTGEILSDRIISIKNPIVVVADGEESDRNNEEMVVESEIEGERPNENIVSRPIPSDLEPEPGKF